MILVDTNLLVYARSADFPQHERARVWLDERLNGVPGVALPWQSILGFVRIASNHRIFRNPLTSREAWKQAEEWLDCTPAWTPEPTERHGEILASLIPSIGNRPNLLPDAHLAALAMEYGLILCSSDADFARFPGLRWENPLSPGGGRIPHPSRAESERWLPAGRRGDLRSLSGGGLEEEGTRMGGIRPDQRAFGH